MDLVESYLKAVAAQLPKATREDIVAELRDEIMGRLEALEERLGPDAERRRGRGPAARGRPSADGGGAAIGRGRRR